LFLIVWGIAPLLKGRIHSGCVTLIAVGVIGFVASVAYPTVSAWLTQIWQMVIGKVVLCAMGTIVGALLILFLAVSGCMIHACTKQPSENATLLVLGAAIRGDQPSKLLRGRLETAYAYLIEHPDAVCIVSGGQREDEVCTEASVMKRYLVEKGIDPARIYEESASTSTFENVKFSREIIEEHGLSPSIAVVTQEFHQFRAQQFVERAGFNDVGAVVAHSPWHLLGSYWIRDFAGVCHMILLGT
jgi:uncharacterized SAM-binding protein YcdF (DUF218 family)